MRSIAALFVTALAGGCVTADPAQIGPFPSAYKATVAQGIKDIFFDPYSLRDVAIAEPRQGQVAFQQGWVVCVRSNGKNRFGAYTGLKDTAFLIRNDKVIGATEDFPDCASMKFTPWPEQDSGPKPR